MKLVSIVGARPEFVQAVSLSTALAGRHEDVLVHTGQHYDYVMSQTFFDELPLPVPAVNLEIGPGSRATQLALMIQRLEATIDAHRPDAVLVRGDTTSTLAGALAASQMGIPVIHVEAGERSYDRNMPEELSRVVADQLADVHFCCSRTAVTRLKAEGINRSVHWVGDVMFDVLLMCRDKAVARTALLDKIGVKPGAYALVTIHRAGNTDDPARLSALVAALNGAPEPIVFPLHPRTKAALAKLDVKWQPHVHVIDPVGYLDMLALEAHARLIATDSGGVQREAYCLEIPCLTLRDETEWVETAETGWNQLVGCDPDRILSAWRRFDRPATHPSIFGDGQAARRIVEALEAGAIEQARTGRKEKKAYDTVTQS
jgi:UDP-N-acetylglucosamine 2-epimerase